MTISTLTHSNEAELAPAFAAARQICRRHAHGFYFASFFLPPHKREAAYAVLAFCRMVDDAMDMPPQVPFRGATAMREHPAVVSPRASLPVIQPQAEHEHACDVDTLDSRLDMLRERLDEIHAGRLELPAVEARSEQQHALLAFAETVRRFQIPRQHVLDFAEGCRMKRTVTRFATWAELENYCYDTGGAVASMMSCVLGLTHSDVHRQAMALGCAMQLTNILRDVKEDGDRGRVYLPQEDLHRFGYTLEELSRGEVNQRFVELMRLEIARARELYRQGESGLRWLAGDGSRLTASVMATMGAAILDAIERQGYDVFSRRADLTTPQRLALLPRAWRRARRQR